MVQRWILVVVATLLAAAPAAAADRTLFDFRGEIPVPGGTLRLEARCDAGPDDVRCRAESRGPAGRGFQAEGRLLLAPRAPAAPEPPKVAPNLPRWF